MIEPEEIRLAAPTGDPVTFVLRTIRPQDYEQCDEIQRHTWGEEFADRVPASLLMINLKLGGVVAGAFDGGGVLQGFIFGQTGVRDGTLVHWSHLMAVRDSCRGLGLGRLLKLYQRRLLLDVGCELAEWTFDPLVSRNAHLNLNRLGAEPTIYQRDVYGDGSTSALHSGIGTDRFVVRWRLLDAGVQARIDGAPPDGPEGADAPVVNADAGGSPLEPPFALPEIPALRVEVPADVQALKAQALDVARSWRSSTRHAFETYFARGYRVPRLDFHPESRRSFYVLLRR
jgi:predicted GNAT superfamily acetyltransferase